MADNPIIEALPKAQRGMKMTAQEWCDRGNRILAGIEPCVGKKYAGEFMFRDDVYWFVENGRPTIGWR